MVIRNYSYNCLAKRNILQTTLPTPVWTTPRRSTRVMQSVTTTSWEDLCLLASNLSGLWRTWVRPLAGSLWGQRNGRKSTGTISTLGSFPPTVCSPAWGQRPLWWRERWREWCPQTIGLCLRSPSLTRSEWRGPRWTASILWILWISLDQTWACGQGWVSIRYSNWRWG